jgi:hypothetical protein
VIQAAARVAASRQDALSMPLLVQALPDAQRERL